MLKYLIAQGLSADEPVKVKSKFHDVIVIALCYFNFLYELKNVCDVTDCRLPYEVADFEPRVFLHSEYVQYRYS